MRDNPGGEVYSPKPLSKEGLSEMERRLTERIENLDEMGRVLETATGYLRAKGEKTVEWHQQKAEAVRKALECVAQFLENKL